MNITQGISLFRTVDRLLTLETKHGAAIEKLTNELEKLKERIIRLETREEIVIVEAKAAAGVAASGVAMHCVSEVSRRLGILEERSIQQQRPDMAQLNGPSSFNRQGQLVPEAS